MHSLNNLTVYTKARENLRGVNALRITQCSFGDIKNQIERAAISVVSNIAEGASR